MSSRFSVRASPASILSSSPGDKTKRTIACRQMKVSGTAQPTGMSGPEFFPSYLDLKDADPAFASISMTEACFMGHQVRALDMGSIPFPWTAKLVKSLRAWPQTSAGKGSTSDSVFRRAPLSDRHCSYASHWPVPMPSRLQSPGCRHSRRRLRHPSWAAQPRHAFWSGQTSDRDHAN